MILTKNRKFGIIECICMRFLNFTLFILLFFFSACGTFHDNELEQFAQHEGVQAFADAQCPYKDDRTTKKFHEGMDLVMELTDTYEGPLPEHKWKKLEFRFLGNILYHSRCPMGSAGCYHPHSRIAYVGCLQDKERDYGPKDYNLTVAHEALHDRLRKIDSGHNHELWMLLEAAYLEKHGLSPNEYSVDWLQFHENFSEEQD